MTTLPILAAPSFDKTFVVEADASGKGVGAVLMQEGRPVAYMSHTLSDRAQGKSVYEKELMAIVMAVQKWRRYLLRRRFIIHTDQKSLRFLLDQKAMSEDQQKWVSKLLGFDFEIKYKPGKDNRVADALSRRLQFAAITTVSTKIWEELDAEVAADQQLKGIVQDLLRDPNLHPGFSLRKGVLYYKERLVLPKNSSRIPMILKEFHDSAWGGHSGIFRTYKRISELFYWEGMKGKIQQYVKGCQICQRNKYEALSPAGLLQPLPIPSMTWSNLLMDFIGGLPKSQGYDTIMVVVDRLSKYAHFIPLTHPFTAKEVAGVFIKEVVRLHRFPTSITSHRDSVFLTLSGPNCSSYQGLS